MFSSSSLSMLGALPSAGSWPGGAMLDGEGNETDDLARADGRMLLSHNGWLLDHAMLDGYQPTHFLLDSVQKAW
jgi:hypothetical protein